MASQYRIERDRGTTAEEVGAAAKDQAAKLAARNASKSDAQGDDAG
jgi:hypothetical protein